MTDTSADLEGARFVGHAGLTADFNANGSLRRFDCGNIALTLFVGNELESGPANLYLRMHGDTLQCIPLLGPQSPTRFAMHGGRFAGAGSWQGIDYALELVLAKGQPAWVWHVHLRNRTSVVQVLDLTYAQDVALAPYGAVRMNEFYVSQYVDHTPLEHATHGYVVASRQNQAADGRHPWCVVGSLRRGAGFATDALQFHGRRHSVDVITHRMAAELPSRRLQHEHSMVVIRDTAFHLQPNASAAGGFFGGFAADHPEATSNADLERVQRILDLPEAKLVARIVLAGTSLPATATLFSAAAALEVRDLTADELRASFAPPWRHEERDEHGTLLSFFHGSDRHVVLRAKELRVLRPHGHLLRTGRHLTPDETALTSTVWMSGVFHSMVTQGHVSINRFLSTVHSYLGLFRSHGQRVFVELGGEWHLLDMPSAFEMAPHACRWIYRHDAGEIVVRAEAVSDSQELVLSVEFTAGAPARCLISHHVALNGDDGSAPGPAVWRQEGAAIVVTAVPDSDVGRRFPDGSFHIVPAPGTQFEHVGGDELLFADGRSRGLPYVCVLTAAGETQVSLRGQLLAESEPAPLCAELDEPIIPRLAVTAPESSALHAAFSQIADIVPWFAHDAFVHYLSPRGLEQYSGGGWGTRDVCQGPAELLLALGRLAPLRDVLLRVMRQQNPDGDWPQWFMFFERERNIRPGDSHGDIVFWPLVVLAQYLTASGDAAVLDERVPFFDAQGPEAGETATVWQHAERALALIERRVIPGTKLAAYGHGDWNDSLQPADPALREQLCSAWTVTLHVQALTQLAGALRTVGRAVQAATLEAWADEVKQDFQRLLVRDGVLAGYALFEEGQRVRHLLHPSDAVTGVRLSSLAMIHAILEDMLTPEQVREHLTLIGAYLSGPDGVRLFDQPMPYHGGPQRMFQRAETATFFGREIGLMYMHAHLRYAQALAHVGDARGFFRALCQAVPIGLQTLVPSASLRQANCYYSSSDAAFSDRYQASAEYDRVMRGAIALDGGWRVYSSGAGIAVGLVMRQFFGLRAEAAAVCIDPVIPPELDGLRVVTTLLGRPVEVCYRIRGNGSGVSAVVLNGAEVPYTRRANPHRPGAAAVTHAELEHRLSADRNVLDVEIG